MVSSVRQNTIAVNATGALIPSGTPQIICNVGQDYAFEIVDRTFAAIDIGTAAGKTQDTTSNPTMGFLFAQFQGAKIERVISADLIKTAAATNTTVFQRFTFSGAGPTFYNLGFRIVNSDNASKSLPGWSPNFSSLYLIDAGTGAAAQIAVGDVVRVLVELGNS